MVRFKLFLVERPRRSTPTLEALGAGDATVRAALTEFLAGDRQDPVALAVGDDHARIRALWDQCHRDGLSVVIFDHSTLWDRLRDRLRAQPAPKTEVTAVAAAGVSVGAQRAAGPELVAPGGFELSPRARVGVITAGIFAALLAVAWAVVPRGGEQGPPDTQGASSAGFAGSRAGGSLSAVAGGGSQSGAAAQASGVAQGRAGGVNPAAAGVDAEVRVREGGGDPAGDPTTGPAALLLAFVVGWALAGIGGVAVSRDGAALTAAQRHGARALVGVVAGLAAAVSVVARLGAEPPPPEAPREAHRDAPMSNAANVSHDAADAAAEAPGGPFARFLRRRRSAGAAAPSRFSSLLSRWRAARSDAGAVPDASARAMGDESAAEPVEAVAAMDAAVAAPPARGERHRRGRHRRRDAGTHDVAPVADVASSDVSPATDVARPAPVAAGRAPTPAEAPARDDALRESVRRADGVAARPAVTPAVRAETPPARPREERRAPLTPLGSFALGVLAGVALSPRWRAVARGAA
jgi:hypothetical protein